MSCAIAIGVARAVCNESCVAVPWGFVGALRFGCVRRRCAMGISGVRVVLVVWGVDVSCHVLSLTRVMDKSRVPFVRLPAARLRSCPVASCNVVSRHLMLLTRVVDSCR